MRVSSRHSDKYFGGWEKDLDCGYRFRAIGVEVLTEAMEGERRFQASVEGLRWSRKERQTEEHQPRRHDQFRSKKT